MEWYFKTVIVGARGRLEITPMTATDGDGNPTKSWTRFCKFSIREIVFIVVVFLTELGCNVSLDTPGALQNAIIENYNLTTSQFSLLYSLYFIPTIILNGFSGFLIDRVMGIRLSTLVYSVIGLLGCVLFAGGGVGRIFWLMLMGRLIFGLGNELATAVCVNYCIFSWYRNTIMNVVSSISSDGSIAGTMVIYQIAPRLYDLLKHSVEQKEALDIVICLASGMFLVTGALAVFMTYLKPKEDVAPVPSDNSPESIANEPVTEEKVATLKDILHFPLVFWCLCLLNGLNCLLNSFSQISQGLLTSPEFQLKVDEASNVLSVMGIVKIVLSLPLSISVDIFGRNTWYIFLAQVIGTVAYFLFAVRVNPYIGMVLAGISTSLYNSAIIPMYAYPLEKHLVGSCYGIMSTTGGLSMFASPMIVGRLVDIYGYSAATYFYFASSAACLLCVIMIWVLDKRSTGILSMTPQQRIEHEKQFESEQAMKKSESQSLEPHSSIDFSSVTSLAHNMVK